MNRKKIIITVSIIVGVLLLLLVVFLVNMSKPNNERKLIKYITQIGFSEDGTMYFKQISKLNLGEYEKLQKDSLDAEYEILYFDVYNKELIKEQKVYNGEIDKDFTAFFDYTDNSLEYIYRIRLNDTNIVMQGTFSLTTEEFTCEPSLSYLLNMENSKKDICNKVKLDAQLFGYEAKTLITEKEILEILQKGN